MCWSSIEICRVKHHWSRNYIQTFKVNSWFNFYFIFLQEHGEPLFSSHMLDLSEEFDEENIGTCVKYFKRMAPMKIWLEMEIGITGGEEDGVDNTAVKADALYTVLDNSELYTPHVPKAHASSRSRERSAMGWSSRAAYSSMPPMLWPTQ